MAVSSLQDHQGGFLLPGLGFQSLQGGDGLGGLKGAFAAKVAQHPAGAVIALPAKAVLADALECLAGKKGWWWSIVSLRQGCMKNRAG